MTRDKKIASLRKHCINESFCQDCILYDKGLCSDYINFNNCSDEQIGKMYDVLYPPPKVEEAPPVENDIIKHPNHYCREGAMECIEELVMLFGKEVVKHFCLCNIWKYRYRSADKNGKQDIDKSDQYVRIYKELCDG